MSTPKGRIKAVHVIDHLRPGGAQEVLRHLAPGLPKGDFEVSVVSLREETPLAGELRSTVNVTSLDAAKYDLAGTARALNAELAAQAPDIVHTHLNFSNVFGARAAHRLGAHAVRHDHSGFVDKGALYRLRRSVGEKLAGGPNTHVIAVSKAVRDFNVSLGVPLERITVIGNGIDLARFNPDATVLDLGWSRGTPVVGFMGRLFWYKGLDLLIKAAPLILKAAPGVKFAVAGDGPQRSQLERAVGRAGLADAFRFFGHIDDRAGFYAALDILAAPSRHESFGLAVAEAMAAGKPVVAARVGGIPEIVTDKETGLLFEPGDFRELAAKISELLLDPALAAHIAEAARARASGFSWDETISKVERVYRKLVSR